MSQPQYVALGRFRVSNGMAAEVVAAFRGRPHRVEEVEGPEQVS